MTGLLMKMALIGVAGIAAQWAAWRIRIPAIALLLLAGILIGPVTGFLDPKESFGDLYKPIIALSVAIILFEGGLTLKFKEIKETSTAVRRIILIGGPLVWLFSALAAHYAAGLDWVPAIVLGGILVVTGPTVIMPLLRQAQLAPRPASLLRWEAIVNDPIGALFAVLAFETYLVINGALTGGALVTTIALAILMAVGGGYGLGLLLARAFKGYVPEYLKSPVLVTTVLLAYAISDAILKETGLLTVTIMGITMANTRMASMGDLRHFKETVTVLLVSGLFIMLTASLKLETMLSLGWGALIFVIIILFIARPIAIFIATTGSGINWREKTLVAWIAPRGIVAVAVSGLFGDALVEQGFKDGAQLTALTFAVVASTIILHGFTLGPLASLLKLKSAERPGLLIVGGSTWSLALAEKLKENDISALIADNNWNHLRAARLADIPVYFGEVLSEAAHHDITFNRYSDLVAASDNDAYNSLVCTEFGREMGRGNVFQLGLVRNEDRRSDLSFTLGGRSLFNPGKTYAELRDKMREGWSFHSTRLTDEYDFSDYLTERPADTKIVLWVGKDGTIYMREGLHKQEPQTGDLIIAFGPEPKEKVKAETITTKKEAPETDIAP
ncbi:MAG: sodium:proton antiporter [Pseudomonadota bacterium]